MAKPKLLRCPFCGGADQWISEIDGIVCRGCNAGVIGAGNVSDIATWNRRHQTYTYVGKDGKPVLARELEDKISGLQQEIARLRRELAEARADHKMVTELYNAAVADYDQAFRNGLEKSAQIAAGYECRLAEYPSDEAGRYYQGGAIDASIGIAAAIRSAMEGKARG